MNPISKLFRLSLLVSAAIVILTITGATGSAAQWVPTPTVASVRFQPRSVKVPTTLTGTVTVSEPVTSTGLGVSLLSNNSAVSVSERVFVAEGRTTANFPATVSAVPADTSVMITAGSGNAQKVTPLPVLAPELSYFTITPATVRSGETANATVMLDGPAPAQGFKVPLTCNAITKVKFPSPVVVKVEEQSASFELLTFGSAETTNITCSADQPKTATLTLAESIATPEYSLLSLTLSQAFVEAGTAVTGTVQTGGPIPWTDSLISVTTSHPGVAFITPLQRSDGGKSGSFTINTQPTVTSKEVSLTQNPSCQSGDKAPHSKE